MALIVGIIAGPLVSNGFSPLSWDDHDEITKELTRCILAIQVSLFYLKEKKSDLNVSSRLWLWVLNYQSKQQKKKRRKCVCL